MEAALAEMAALHLEQEAEAEDDKDFLAPVGGSVYPLPVLWN